MLAEGDDNFLSHRDIDFVIGRISGFHSRRRGVHRARWRASCRQVHLFYVTNFKSHRFRGLYARHLEGHRLAFVFHGTIYFKFQSKGITWSTILTNILHGDLTADLAAYPGHDYRANGRRLAVQRDRSVVCRGKHWLLLRQGKPRHKQGKDKDKDQQGGLVSHGLPQESIPPLLAAGLCKGPRREARPSHAAGTTSTPSISSDTCRPSKVWC
ncbi:hypothetical protein MOOTH_23370 [Moorella thermoacetica]|nr:hypothetical protein MOOTH_23370 [Moorella thermoacetica]